MIFELTQLAENRKQKTENKSRKLNKHRF